LPLTTLRQETRWAYSTTLPSPHGAFISMMYRYRLAYIMSQKNSMPPKIVDREAIHCYNISTYAETIFSEWKSTSAKHTVLSEAQLCVSCCNIACKTRCKKQ